MCEGSGPDVIAQFSGTTTGRGGRVTLRQLAHWVLSLALVCWTMSKVPMAYVSCALFAIALYCSVHLSESAEGSQTFKRLVPEPHKQAVRSVLWIAPLVLPFFFVSPGVLIAAVLPLFPLWTLPSGATNFLRSDRLPGPIGSATLGGLYVLLIFALSQPPLNVLPDPCLQGLKWRAGLAKNVVAVAIDQNATACAVAEIDVELPGEGDRAFNVPCGREDLLLGPFAPSEPTEWVDAIQPGGYGVCKAQDLREGLRNDAKLVGVRCRRYDEPRTNLEHWIIGLPPEIREGACLNPRPARTFSPIEFAPQMETPKDDRELQKIRMTDLRSLGGASLRGAISVTVENGLSCAIESIHVSLTNVVGHRKTHELRCGSPGIPPGTGGECLGVLPQVDAGAAEAKLVGASCVGADRAPRGGARIHRN